MNTSQALTPKPQFSLKNFLDPVFQHTGQGVMSFLEFVGGFTLLSVQAVKECFSRPFYIGLTIDQLYQIGVRSIFLVAVTALATGSVMALQFGFGLEKFGGKLYVPRVVATVILREMGPVFTSLLVAGRIGSGITAEVSSMKVSQQIDAMRALGTSPIKKIVIPRLIATLIALPLLTLFANYIGLIGASLVSYNELNIHYEYFWQKTIETIKMVDLLTGLTKSAVFAFFIAIAACWRGLNTEGGTQGVGNSTTWIVVVSSVFIMIGDFFLTKLFIITVFPKM